MANAPEIEETTSRICAGNDPNEGRTQTNTITASSAMPTEIIIAPARANTGDNVIPAATIGVPPTTPVATSTNVLRAGSESGKVRPARPAMIGAANPAKWKWTAVSSTIVAPKPTG